MAFAGVFFVGDLTGEVFVSGFTAGVVTVAFFIGDFRGDDKLTSGRCFGFTTFFAAAFFGVGGFFATSFLGWAAFFAGASTFFITHLVVDF